ncbi:MAG: hypothetical protein HYR84_08485 [Planctomycetes bacterium]|nr:hypothetical protein [Planctomycetota bacterium]
MSFVSEIWTWQEGERIYSRLTTNVSAKRFLARLTALRLLESVETIHAYFGDRADGGNGYELLWKRTVTWEDLQVSLPKI